jgi:hypothetical protein
MVNLDEMTEEEILEYANDLSEEEFEQLDELSKARLLKYGVAATGMRGTNPNPLRAMMGQPHPGSIQNLKAKGDDAKAKRRQDFVIKAGKALGIEKTPGGATIRPGSYAAKLKNEEYDLDEAAIDTLKPGGAPGETKAQTLDTFVQLLAQLGKEDLSDLFNQVQAQYGPGQAPGAVDNSQNNAATVAMKPSAAVGTGAWKEDLDDLFTGDDLTEELKEKTQVVFEAAVNTRAALVEAKLEEQFEEAVEALEEEYNEKLQEQANEIFESVTDKLDQYLDYVIEKWMTENEIAVESGIRVQIAEDFMDSLHGVFTEHYITIPESKLDIVADLKEQVEELSEKLNSVLDEKIQLESVNKEFTKSQIIEELSEDLAETQVDKLSTLAEGLEYTDPDNFKRKVSILKERYFGTSSKTTGLITEVIDGTVDEERATTGFNTPEMKAYAQAISKSVK